MLSLLDIAERSVEDLREQAPEYQQIEVCREVKFLNKNEAKALFGLLNRRNECAHPSNYSPTLNETLGFISELLSRVSMLQRKPYCLDYLGREI